MAVLGLDLNDIPFSKSNTKKFLKEKVFLSSSSFILTFHFLIKKQFQSFNALLNYLMLINKTDKFRYTLCCDCSSGLEVLFLFFVITDMANGKIVFVR